MSRIGKKPIEIPEKTTVSVGDNSVVVKGPLGELSKQLHQSISVSVENNQVIVSPKNNSPLAQALWGTYGSHIKNMIQGVNQAYEKQLVLEGIGYKVSISGDTLELIVGFSHPVKMEIPKGIIASVEKNVISISGSNKEQVGQFTAEIRAVKKPEPYKGKGLRYKDEVIRRKQGKKTV